MIGKSNCTSTVNARWSSSSSFHVNLLGFFFDAKHFLTYSLGTHSVGWLFAFCLWRFLPSARKKQSFRVKRVIARGTVLINVTVGSWCLMTHSDNTLPTTLWVGFAKSERHLQTPLCSTCAYSHSCKPHWCCWAECCRACDQQTMNAAKWPAVILKDVPRLP